MTRIAVVTALILTCAVALAQDQPAGVIIEMDDYEARVPDDGSFAEVTNEAFASRRRVNAILPPTLL